MKNNKSKSFNLASRIKDVHSDNMKRRINTLESVIGKKLKTINGLITRNGGRGLIGILLKYIRGIRPRLTKSVVKQISWFCIRCYHIATHSGLKGLVLYLKASQVLLQQSVGGYRVVDLAELKVRPARNRAGVPLIIPAGVRVMISRDRDINSIKLWMTLLGLYRVLEFKGTVSFDTITDKGTDISSFLPEWRDFLRNHFKPNLETLIDLPELSPPDIFPILKSGPTSGVDAGYDIKRTFTNSSVKALVIAARVYLRKGLHSKLLPALSMFCSQIPGGESIVSRLRAVAMVTNMHIDYNVPDLNTIDLGKLGFKAEPAGKVRVFAMVDAWTQWLMYPLHKWIFSVLREIPQDGTFDQMAPIHQLQEYYGEDAKGLFSSIDLSAATDRLPIELQIPIIEVLFEDLVPDSKQFARAWADLLVERYYGIPLLDPKKAPYHFPKALNKALRSDTGTGFPFDLTQAFEPGDYLDLGNPSVKYAVGQPMGALSSWAMLALTHHAMMQFSAYKAGEKGWFSDYAVLGDDGVIKGRNPTNNYIQLLKVIGVKAGLAKSILSKNRFVIEFAKKFFVDGTTANMLPIKECAATDSSTSLVAEFARKYELSLNSVLSFLGYGYKVKMRVFKTLYFKLPTRLRVLLVWLSHPNSPFGKEYWVDWLLQKSWSEEFVPSEDALNLVLSNLEDLNEGKLKSINTSFDLYTTSLKEVDTVLDDRYPITVTTITSSAVMGGSVPGEIPWKAILSPDTHSADIDYDYLTGVDTGGVSSHTKRFQDLRDLEIGLDMDDVVDEFRSKLASEGGDLYADTGPLSEGPCWGGYHLLETSDKIDIQCQYYFQLDELKSLVPEKFWEEYRKDEKPFKDFLTVYKFWQAATKPLWAEFYGKDLSLPLKSEPKIKRGEPEGLVKHKIPSEPPKGFPWVYFIMGVLISFGICEFIHNRSNLNAIIIPFSYDIISSETELFDAFKLNTITPPQFPLGWWICGSVGLFLVCGTIVASIYEGQFFDLSWYLIQRDIPEILISPPLQPALQLDTVIVGSMRISGSVSANSLRLIQIHLENGALLDNLAISPIGALWELPIV